MKKYLLMSSGILLGTLGFSQEVSNKKQVTVTKNTAVKENTVPAENNGQTIMVSSGKQAVISTVPTQTPVKTEEESTPAMVTSSKKNPK